MRIKETKRTIKEGIKKTILRMEDKSESTDDKTRGQAVVVDRYDKDSKQTKLLGTQVVDVTWYVLNDINTWRCLKIKRRSLHVDTSS